MVEGKKSTTEEQNIMSNWCRAGVSQVNQIRRLVPRLTCEYDVTPVSLYVHDICNYTVGSKRRKKKGIANPKVPEWETCKKSGEYFGKDLVTRQDWLSHITTERLMKRIKRGPD